MQREITAIRSQAPLRAAHRSGRRIVAFHVPSSFMFTFSAPIWKELMKKHQRDIFSCFIVEKGHSTDPVAHLLSVGVPRECIIPVQNPSEVNLCDLFLTPTFASGKPRSSRLTVQLFHGLAGWGMTKWASEQQHDIFRPFTDLFITGPMLQNTLTSNAVLTLEPTIQFHSVGYPKTDSLFDGVFSKHNICKDLGLDSSKPLILYAPTWEKEASLHTDGISIIRTLAKEDVNILVKLHPNSYFAKGECEYQGVRWLREMEALERRHPNLRNIRAFNSNPYLVASDLLITDVSGIGFEFLLLNKPIIYWRCPKFENTHGLSDLQTEAYGVGRTVETPEKLQRAIFTELDPSSQNTQARKKFAETLVYNPGTASAAAAREIHKLLFS